MLQNMTRSKVIEVWFAAVALGVLAAVALGVSATIGTAVVVSALCLVPPAIVLMLWPGIQPPTVAEVLYDAEGRR